MERSSRADVLRHVETYLNAQGVSFASLVIEALRDSGSTLAKDLISRITDIFDALRPNLDDGPITELGRFFASVVSSELSELGEDDLWNLPATRLSARRLQEFSVKKMTRQIASTAPGFSSFLHSICAGKRMLSEVAVDDDEDDDNGFRPGTRRSVDLTQLLEIVCFLAYRTYLAHAWIRRRWLSPTSSSTPATGSATHFRSQSVYTSTRQTLRTKSSALSTTPDSVFHRRASPVPSGRYRQKHCYLFPPLGEACL